MIKEKERFMNINFFCVGAQKAGTTTLHNILSQHPCIYLPESKEAHFFNVDDKFDKGLEWYKTTFYNKYQGETVCGSCNPEYMYFEDVPKRIYETLGSDIKFVFIFRNPVDRAYSNYLMSKSHCIEELSFKEAIRREKDRIVIDFFHKTHFSYISRGYYAQQVKRYLQYFPLENLFFIRFEDDLIKNRNATIAKLGTFLGVDTKNLDINIKSNVAKSARFKVVQRFLYKDNDIKSFFSRFINPNTKIKIHKFLNSISTRSEKRPLLDNKIKKELLKNYINDISELEELTRLKFSRWML